MKKGNRFLAFLLSAMLAAGSVYVPVVAGEVAGEYATAEAATNTYADAVVEAVEDSMVDATEEAVEDSAADSVAAEDSVGDAAADATEETVVDGDFAQSSYGTVSEEANATETVKNADMAAEDEASVPKEVPASINVTLDANGGYFANEWDDILGDYVERAEILNKVILSGDSFGVSVIPLYDTADSVVTFLGWSLVQNGDLVVAAGEDYFPASKCVLYAVWNIEEREKAVSIDRNQDGNSDTDYDGNEENFDSENSIEEGANLSETVADSAEDAAAPTETEASPLEEGVSFEDGSQEENGEQMPSDETGNKGTVDESTADDIQESEAVEKAESGEGAEAGTNDNIEDAQENDSTGASVEETNSEPDAAEGLSQQDQKDCPPTLSYEGKQETVSSDAMMSTVDSGKCGEKLTWTLDDAGTLSISGTGEMKNYGYDYYSDHTPWYSSVKTIIIEEGVTSIGNYAFCDCSSLTSITLPASLTSIGQVAFTNCSSLTSITLPASLTSIGKVAFDNCRSLTSITLPASLTSIEEYAFCDCRNLTSITLPVSLTSIGDYAFCECSSLTSITLPASLTSIGNGAFSRCSSFTSITLPASLTSIGDGVFSRCSSLTSINVDSRNITFSSNSGVLFNKSRTTIISCPVGKNGGYSIPDGVTSIGKYAFCDCTSLTSIKIPEGVTSIGKYAFYYCSNLTSITIPGGVTSIGDYSFSGCNNLLDVFYAGTKEQWESISIGYSNSPLYNSAIIHYGNYAMITLEDKYVLYENKPQDIIISTDVHSEDFAPNAANMQWSFGAHSGTSVQPGSLSVVGGPTDYIASYLSTYTGAGDYEIKTTLYNNGNMEKKLAEASAVLHILDLHAVETPRVTDCVRKVSVAWTEVEDAEEYELSFTRTRTDENGRESTYNFEPIMTSDTMYTLNTAGVMPGDVFKVVIVPGAHELKGTAATIDDIYVSDDIEACVNELNAAMDDFLTTMKDEADSQRVSESPEEIKEQNISSIASGAKSSKMLTTGPGTDAELSAIYLGYSQFIVDHFTEFVRMESVSLSDNWAQIESAFIKYVQNNLSHEEETYEINGYSVKVETTGYGDAITGTIVLKKDGLQKQIVSILSTTKSVQQLMTKFSENMQEVMEAAMYDALTSVVDEIGDKTGIKDWTESKAKSAFNKVLAALRYKGFGNILDNIQKMCNLYKAANSVLDIMKVDSVAEANKKAKSCYETLNKIEITTATAEYNTMTSPNKKAFDKVLDKKKALEKALQYMYGGTGGSGSSGSSGWDSGGGTGGGVSGVDDPASEEYKAAHNVTNAVVTGIPTITYTGKAQKPAIKAAIGSITLTSGTDYTVSYANNTNAGTATVTITGKGNYTGTTSATFKINKASQSITTKTAASPIAVGKTTTVSITGNKGSKSFKSSDTTVATVSSTGKVTAKKVGKVTITVTSAATANYKAASKNVTIKVVPAATASLTAANQATGIKLTWKKVPGANAYFIYRGSTQIAAIRDSSTVTYTDKKANTNGAKYTYKIIASASATGRSTLSKSVTTYCVARPTISTLTNSAAAKMTVKWGKNTKATGYQIQYSTSKTFVSGNKTANVTKAATVSKVIGSLTKGKTYYVRIRTYKTVGSTKYWSTCSPAKSVKISK